MKFRSYIYFIFIFFFIVGCSQPTINIDEQPKLQVPKEPIKVQRKKGALYSRQGASLFADKKDLQVGDILQVIIEEKLSNSSKGSRDIKKDNATSLGAGVIVPSTGLQGVSKTAAEKINTNLSASFQATTANAFKAASTSSLNENFSTTVSVIIEQTYQNGNYFVKGTKEMLIDGQKQGVAISGVIRPYDISPENTIYSHQLANLKIQYVQDGDENSGLHKSWGTKALETIWPF